MLPTSRNVKINLLYRAKRSASDSEYSFSSATNFPMYWNLARRPHSDSAIDLLERLEVQNSSPVSFKCNAMTSEEN